MKQYIFYLNGLIKFSLMPTVLLALVLLFFSAFDLLIVLLYFSFVFASSHALHLTMAFKDSRSEKLTSNAMLGMGLKFLVILIGSVVYFVLMEMSTYGILLVILLYVCYMFRSAKFFY